MTRRFTKEEINFMLENRKELTPCEIGVILNRASSSIRGFFNRKNLEYKKIIYNKTFTNRELDVLRLMARGLTNEDIAIHLFISTTTVKTHISSIFSKLQLIGERSHVTRVRAVLYYLNNKDRLEREYNQ